jgi:phenylpropionate dioxygenase-like ring-hydroxylating dioxygenase large terminal subunit
MKMFDLADKAGKLHALSSICSHRGAPLVNGWVDHVNGESCVRCPYHSWAFSGDGILRHVPSEQDGAFPRRALQESFDVRAKSGYLWVYWGNPKMPSAVRAPIPGSTVPSNFLSQVQCQYGLKRCEMHCD